MKNQNETGRSLAEMLLIEIVIILLAVIAILTFQYLVDKNKASNLLYEATKQAVLITGQLNSGKTPTLTLNEEDPPLGGYFATVIERKNHQFKLIAFNVDQSVCEKMKKMLKEKKPLRRIEGDCGGPLKFVFNDDFSVNDPQEEVLSPACQDVLCPDYAPCLAGECDCPLYKGKPSKYRPELDLCCYEDQFYNPQLRRWQENLFCL